MISAREHYYTHFAPEENWKNYQQVYQSHLYEGNNHPDAIRIFSHVPNYSNDKLIEQYVSELRGLVSSSVAEQLEKIFVAKRRNFFANAGALHAEDKYEGDLVFFFVGLSDVLFQYATLQQEFRALTDAREELGDEADETKSLFQTVCRNIGKLSEAQVDWGIRRNEIRFKEATVLVASPEMESVAATIATYMDKAVLRHEIAHHLLGHTVSGADLGSQLRPHIAHLLEKGDYPDEHLREIEADLCAIYLPVSGVSQESLDQRGFEVALGTLMAQTTLAQLKASIHLDAVSHPSWKVRHELSLAALRHFYPGPGCEYAISEVSRFQALLYKIQGRGLGELTVDNY